MATFIRSVDGRVQVEIEPESPATMLPNISDQGLQAQIDALRTEIRTYRGQPVVVTDAADMEDELTIYLYMGSEEGYNANHWYYYDGTEWVDGGEYVANPVLIDDTLTQSGEAADAKVTGDEISAIKADLTQLDNKLIATREELGVSHNLFDKDSAEDNKYCSGLIGETMTLAYNANYCALVIDAKPSTTYTITGYEFPIKELNSNNVIIASRSNTTFITTENTVKLGLSVTLSHKDTYMIVEGNTLPSSYEAYGENLIFATKEELSEAVPTTYEVGTGKTYTSFTACLEALQNNSNNKRILVYEGTYDIFEEIGGADYVATIQSGANWRDVSVVVPPNTKIIGVGDVVFEFLPESSEMPAAARNVLSALNVSGNVEIENIKIRAKNCHYCIHDETSSLAMFNNVTHKYKNVECIKYSGDGDAQAFAAGFQQGGKYDFEGCLFKSGQGKAFSMHNSSTGGATINIKDCVIITTTSAVAVDFVNVSGQQVRNIINLCGCYLENNGGTKRLSITGGSVNTFDVTCISCSDVGDTTIDISGNLYPIKQYNKFNVT